MGDNGPLAVVDTAVLDSEAMAVNEEFGCGVSVEVGGGGGP